VADKTTRTLQPNEVYIETTHSGLCGTDECVSVSDTSSNLDVGDVPADLANDTDTLVAESHAGSHLHTVIMSVTFEVFRGSKEGKIVADKTTRTLQL
jgi:hypothetical protein